MTALLLGLLGCADAPEGARPFADADQARYRQVCADGPVVEGIDVSYWQGTIDWDAVAADGIEFAVIRVSHGLGTYDTQFTRNWSEARRVGVRRGVYQYFDAHDDPAAQARLLLDEMGPLQDGDLPPVLDVEQGDNEGIEPAEMVADITTWMEVVEGELGVVPMIYAGAYGWSYLTDDADFTDHPLWTANWVDDCPLVANPWEDWAFWQYSATGSVAGISGDVDRDRFNGDASALDAWAWHPTDACSGVCEVAADAETIVEEDDACACPEGAPTAIDGHGGHAWSTPADADGAERVTWPLRFAQAGVYDLWVWVPDQAAPTEAAVWTVAHDGVEESVVADQAAAHEWSLLGSFRFAASGVQSVAVLDAYGDDGSAGRDVAMDAVRWVPVQTDCECDEGDAQEQTCSDDGVRTRTCEACVWSEWSACRGQAAVVEPEGCGCGSAAPAAGLVALGAAAAMARRARVSRRGG